MIKKITEIKHFGIFRFFKAQAELSEFSKFNLFYGWNGSGKSTLSRVFFSLAAKKIHSSFMDGRFKFVDADSREINEGNLASNALNLFVFNSDFIQRNVDFSDHKAKSILILSEEKIEEVKKLKALQAVIQEQSAIVQRKQEDLETERKKVEALYTNIARNVKKSFELIETNDHRLLNYKAPTLKAFITQHQGSIGAASILSSDMVAKTKAESKSTQKPDVTYVSKFGDEESVETNLQRLNKVLEKSITSKQITRLIDHPDINSWVHSGLELWMKTRNQTCDFCANEISDSRIAELNAHFSKEYQQLMDEARDLDLVVGLMLNSLDVKLPDVSDFYDELTSRYKAARGALQDSCHELKQELQRIGGAIKKKIGNPFELISISGASTLDHFISIKKSEQIIRDIVSQHNEKNKKFNEAVRNAQHQLELHFVSDFSVNEKLIEQGIALEATAKELEEFRTKMNETYAEIDVLERDLVTEVKGADRFNESLSKFLGRKDISLKFDALAKGYQIIRGNDAKPAANLSEGEKTAIAFVYFMNKLRESGNSIKESIVLLDDPISSFDSNHLFHSCSYIKKELEDCVQLFILTHNFQFFRLLRDWLIRKNTRRKKADASGEYEEVIKSRFYTIECSAEVNRSANILNAPESLLEYNSEYHYIFSKLHSYRNLASLDLEKSFLIANLSRKILEGFLSFKLPKQRSDFHALLRDGCRDAETREKVYKFINKYSHSQGIEFHDSAVDNLLGEGANIVNDVFSIMKSLDEQHFFEMEIVCST